MPYEYAIVCGWGIQFNGNFSAHRKGHAGLLIISAEHPWDGKDLPFVSVVKPTGKQNINKEELIQALNSLEIPELSQIKEQIITQLQKNAPLSSKTRDSCLLNLLALSKTLYDLPDVANKEHVISVIAKATETLKHFEYTRMHKLMPGYQIKEYLSTNTLSAITNFNYELERYNGLPNSWIAIPGKTEQRPGVDLKAIHRWWKGQAEAMDAFTFAFSKLRSNKPSLDEAAKVFFEENRKPHYVVFAKEEQYYMAYKNPQGKIKWKLLPPEKALTQLPSIIYPQLKIIRDLFARDVIDKTLSEFAPNKSNMQKRYSKEKYAYVLNNCSTLIRKALTVGLVDSMKQRLFSTPLNLIQDCYKGQGEYSENLLAFVTACINRMSKDDHHYTKAQKESPKMARFKQLREEIKATPNWQNNPDLIEKVNQASTMQRGQLTLGRADTEKAFNSYKTRLAEVKKNSHQELSFTADIDRPKQC